MCEPGKLVTTGWGLTSNPHAVRSPKGAEVGDSSAREATDSGSDTISGCLYESIWFCQMLMPPQTPGVDDAVNKLGRAKDDRSDRL